MVASIRRVLAVLACSLAGLDAAQAEPEMIELRTRAIETFEIGSTETRFGPFEFVGGLELTARARSFGGLSGLVMFADDRIAGVFDQGRWFEASLTRDSTGRLDGVLRFTVAPMRGAAGEIVSDKAKVDAEGIALDGDSLLVAFEREHRVSRYPLQPFPPSDDGSDVPIIMPRHELRHNGGLETVAVAPDDGPLEGAAVIVAEQSINPAGDLFAAVLDGPRQGTFFVKRHLPYSVTDAAFLPDGDLLLLERRFGISDGVGMRLRAIDADGIRPGATVDGEVLLEAGFGHQIDNMEALDVVRLPGGETRLMIASDDNHSILQRTLLLEFRLVSGSP